MADFEEALNAGYGFEGPGIIFGAAMREDETFPGLQVRVPLAMMNRHGLVAGATGTGKTKTLQVLAEQLSDAGVPVFISDIKGDISGLAAPAVLNEKLTARAASIGFADYAARAFPVEFLTLDRDGKGVRLRASVSSFGPILLAKVLDLNDTQQSVLALAFKYADDKQLPLVNLDDLRALLNHLNSDEGKSEMAEYGGVATATAGVIIRKIVELEQQEADAFFGSPEFDVDHFLRVTDEGRGVVNVLELADMQDRPALFSTFMMWLLASLYESLPEVGDQDKPKLVFFFDEAHLLFRDANKTFMQQIELVARLIRSKGVGVFFVTHSPTDVPAEVLGQLGNRVQHALRAFTPDDLETVRATAQTFPTTEFYDVEDELTKLGIGEALITALDPKGRPMPTVRTHAASAHVADGAGRAGGHGCGRRRVADCGRPTRSTPTRSRRRSSSPRGWRRRRRRRRRRWRASRIPSRRTSVGCGRPGRPSVASTGARWPPRDPASCVPGRSTPSCAPSSAS